MDLTMIVREGGTVRQHTFPPGRITIGRGPSCDVVLQSRDIAPLHAWATWHQDRWLLVTATKDAVVEVEGRRLKSLLIGPATRASLGGARIAFTVGSPAEHAPTGPAGTDGVLTPHRDGPSRPVESDYDTLLRPLDRRRLADALAPAPAAAADAVDLLADEPHRLESEPRPQGRLSAAADELTYVTGLAFSVVVAALRPATWVAPIRETLVRQIYFVGVRSLAVVAVVGALVGPGVVLEARHLLQQFGEARLLGDVFVVFVVGELAPLLVNLIVLVRSGSVIATELGTMSARGEIDVLEAQGIDAIHYLVVPRVIGMVIAVPFLTVFFDVIAFSTGYAASALLELHPMRPMQFVADVLQPLRMANVVSTLLKTIVPPMMVGVICAYAGLMVEQSPTSVPRSTARALLSSVVAVFFSTLLITAILYL